jgi:hypothetical protein
MITYFSLLLAMMRSYLSFLMMSSLSSVTPGMVDSANVLGFIGEIFLLDILDLRLKIIIIYDREIY